MDQSTEYGQANFTLPHDMVILPSQGVFYKNRKNILNFSLKQINNYQIRILENYRVNK